MNNIQLTSMTKELARSYFREFTNDPDVFADMTLFRDYAYSEQKADEYVEHQKGLGRVHLAITKDDKVIGEIILKKIDRKNQCCTLSIHLKNDSVKNMGYGTEAEMLALRYAFHKLQMETVYADAIIKNTRSQHVLKKVGFTKMGMDDTFCYFRCDKATWKSASDLL